MPGNRKTAGTRGAFRLPRLFEWAWGRPVFRDDPLGIIFSMHYQPTCRMSQRFLRISQSHNRERQHFFGGQQS